jgi:hypothetical protein
MTKGGTIPAKGSKHEGKLSPEDVDTLFIQLSRGTGRVTRGGLAQVLYQLELTEFDEKDIADMLILFSSSGGEVLSRADFVAILEELRLF